MKIVRAASIFILLLGYFATAQVMDSPHFTLHQVGDGIYAAIHKEGGSAVCNAGIVDMGEYLLIFDTFMTVQAARDLKKAAMVILNKPIRVVINSHGHSDHIRGNQIFPEALIIGSDEMRAFILRKTNLNDEKERLTYALRSLNDQIQKETDPKKKNNLHSRSLYYQTLLQSLNELVITLPQLSIDSHLVIHGKNRTAMIRHFQKGHTISDLILFLPEDSLMFTGDLVFHRFHPNMTDSYPEHWIRNLDTLMKYPAKIVVSGHGPIGTIDAISAMKEYFLTLKQLAGSIISPTKQWNDSLLPPIPGQFSDYQFPAFYRNNVKIMYETFYSRDQQKDD